MPSVSMPRIRLVRSIDAGGFLESFLVATVASILGLAFLGKKVQRIAAIVGGIGFGLFIDELGKFITSDNDYFYQPTIAIIYAVFIVIFMANHAIQRRRAFSQTEY